jgi:ABC-type multidrug transport system fused ATPase/permease subunit
MTSRLTALSTLLFFLSIAPALGQTTETIADSESVTVSVPPAGPATTAGVPAESASDAQVINDFQTLLRAHPRDLSTIIRLDPSLLANEQFLAKYPELAALVAQYPQLGRNPRLYVDRASLPSIYLQRSQTPAESVAEMVSIMFTVLIIALAVIWLIRTVIEQRRWNRLAKVQSEAHGKLLDRLTQNEDLLRYIESPAGSRFLESAPIQVSTGTSNLPRFAPASSMLWSVQIGIIVAAGSLGMVLVSGFLDEGARQTLAMGVIGLCIGLGFAASGVVATLVSKRLGLEQTPPAARPAGE